MGELVEFIKKTTELPRVTAREALIMAIEQNPDEAVVIGYKDGRISIVSSMNEDIHSLCDALDIAKAKLLDTLG